ncbi:MAG: methionyl-tRNA formyltransferase [Patescibacteria group bacterium]
MNEKTKNIKIVFMGSADFSVPILLELAEKFTVQAVVTEIDKPAGRGSEMESPPTKKLALELGLPCHQPTTIVKNQEFNQLIASYNPDVIIVAAYGKILPPEILNLPKNGCLNVHPSLLPKYRGASPIQTALLNGEKKSGVSIILMDQRMDTGDIITQEEMNIEPEDDYVSLSKKMSVMSAQILADILEKYINNEVKLKIQHDSQAIYTKKISKYDGRIDWQKKSVDVYNQIRAYADWPGSYTFFDKKKLDIIKARPVELDQGENFQIGQVVSDGQLICVRCSEGFLELQSIKLEGKKETLIKDFINGYQKFVGTLLG